MRPTMDTQLNLHYAHFQPLNWWSNMYGPTCVLSLLRPLPEEHGKAEEIEGVVMVEVGNKSWAASASSCYASRQLDACLVHPATTRAARRWQQTGTPCIFSV